MNTGYYVSIIRGKRRGLLLGPYVDHQTALDNVKRGTDSACDADPRAWFDAFGTCKIDTEKDLPKSVFGC